MLMSGLTLTSLGLLFVFIALSSVAQLCMKAGVRAGVATSTASGRGVLRYVVAAVAGPLVLVGIGLYLLAAFAWLPLISRVRLSIAYPMVSLSYVVVVVLSAWVLREQVRWRLALPGLLLIGVGVSLIGLAAGSSQSAHGGRPQPSASAVQHWHSLPGPASQVASGWHGRAHARSPQRLSGTP
jgi:drug/metabolite transporter (DMT)-like permease